MFGRRDDPGVMEAGHRGAHVPRHRLRVLAERPHANDGIQRVAVHVGRRGEVGVQACGPEFLPEDRVHLPCIVDGPSRPEPHVARPGAAVPGKHRPRAFLIRRQQRRDAGPRAGQPLQFCHERRRLCGIDKVVVAQVARADMVIAEKRGGARRRGAGKCQHEHLAHLLFQRQAVDRRRRAAQGHRLLHGSKGQPPDYIVLEEQGHQDRRNHRHHRRRRHRLPGHLILPDEE